MRNQMFVDKYHMIVIIIFKMECPQYLKPTIQKLSKELASESGEISSKILFF